MQVQKKEYTVTTQEIIKQEQTEALEKLQRRIHDYETALQSLKYNIESLEITLEETRDALDVLYDEEVLLAKKINGFL